MTESSTTANEREHKMSRALTAPIRDGRRTPRVRVERQGPEDFDAPRPAATAETDSPA